MSKRFEATQDQKMQRGFRLLNFVIGDCLNEYRNKRNSNDRNVK